VANQDCHLCLGESLLTLLSLSAQAMPIGDAVRKGLKWDVKRPGNFAYVTAFLGIILQWQ
jgi:hypothetical protein